MTNAILLLGDHPHQSQHRGEAHWGGKRIVQPTKEHGRDHRPLRPPTAIGEKP